MEATQHSGKCQTCPLPHPGDAPCWGPGTGGGERGGLQLYRWSSTERRPWGGWGPQSLRSGSLLPACERTLSHPRPGPGLRHVARAAEREDSRISEPPALGCSGTAAWTDQGVSTCQPPLGGPAQGPRPPASAVTGQGAGHSGGVCSCLDSGQGRTQRGLKPAALPGRHPTGWDPAQGCLHGPATGEGGHRREWRGREAGPIPSVPSPALPHTPSALEPRDSPPRGTVRTYVPDRVFIGRCPSWGCEAGTLQMGTWDRSSSQHWSGCRVTRGEAVLSPWRPPGSASPPLLPRAPQQPFHLRQGAGPRPGLSLGPSLATLDVLWPFCSV